MKISKSIIRRIKNIVLSVGFVSTFAFGHLIACNSVEKETDYTPVITVPIYHVHNVDKTTYTPTNNIYYGVDMTLKPSDDDYLDINSPYTNPYYEIDLRYTFDTQGTYSDFYVRSIELTYDNNNVTTTLDLSVTFSDNFDDILFTQRSFNYWLSISSYTDSNDNDGYLYEMTIYVDNSSLVTFKYFARTDVNYGNIGFETWSSDILFDFPFTRGTYQDGINVGIDTVLNNPNDYDLYTYNEYLAYGQSEYQRGFNASQNTLSFAGFVHEIFRSPITMFKDAFNFNLPLGNGEIINVGAILTFFLSIGIALTIVQLVLKIGGK